MCNKIGILTSVPSFKDNYGAILQAYALTKKLEFMGYEPYIIRYHGDTPSDIKMKHSVLSRIKAILINNKTTISEKILILMTKKVRLTTQQKFKRFEQDYLRFNDEKITTYEELLNSPPDYDCFITGSDQVWNPRVHHNHNDRGYFLDFVPTGRKRVAYAPSIGVNELPDSCKTNLKQLLEKMDAISIREQSGADIIKTVTDLDVSVVLDPTLLHDRKIYDSIACMPPAIPENYIVCYKFGRLKEVSQKIREISKKMNLPIILIPSGYDTEFEARYDIGPREFLGLIKNAKLVCTDSFHATCFSIIYNKPFLTFPRHVQQAKSSMNTRMECFLRAIGMEERYIESKEKIELDRILYISYESINNILAKMRKESIIYLQNALQEK